MARRPLAISALAAAALLVLSGCAAGEGSAGDEAPATDAAGDWSTDTLNIDFATYNPLSLVIRDQGWLEEAVGDAVTVNWVQSAGSNRANEALRAGAIDIGSTAGSAALLARANGSPIQTIDVYGQPNWAAILVGPDSDIGSVEDLRGRTIAATRGTDPYFFLLQALEQAGVGLDEVTIENLQHADGRSALEAGRIDAWSGLDPLLSTSVATAGSRILFDDIDFNTYGFLNATEEFATDHPDLTALVVNAYESARVWAQANPEETVAILAETAAIDQEIASAVLVDRTNLAISGVPGADQRAVLEIVGPILVESGDVSSREQVDAALETLFLPDFAETADAGAFG